MKKIALFLLLLGACVAVNAQKVGIGTTTPQYTLTVKDTNSVSSNQGFAQVSNNGQVAVGTYVDNSSAYIQTHSNHDLHFATNNGSADLTLQKLTGNFGIGTVNPQATLHVAGTIRLDDGNQGTGKVLTSDASGNASWQIPPSAITLPYVGSDTSTGTTFNISNFHATTGSVAITGYGTGYGTGVKGLSSGGSGIFGSSTVGYGVEASSGSGVAGYFSSGSGLAIKTGTGGTEINGNLIITSGVPGAGKILTSDASGNATWQTTVPKTTSFVSYYQSTQYAMPSTNALSGALPYSDAATISGIDNGNNFNNGAFTAPTAGLYHFSYQASLATIGSLANQKGDLSIYLIINGLTYRIAIIKLGLSDPIPVTIGDAADVYLNVGDVVDVRFKQEIATQIYLTPSIKSHFVGYQVY